MKVKKWLISLVAVIGLCGLNNISIHASSYMSYNLNHAKYHRSMRYVTKPIKIEKLNNSSVFAYIKKTGSRQLYIGQRVGINQFYHMGNDGFVVYIPHHNRTIYYAPSNSHRWFGSKYQARRAKIRNYKKNAYRYLNNLKNEMHSLNSFSEGSAYIYIDGQKIKKDKRNIYSNIRNYRKMRHKSHFGNNIINSVKNLENKEIKRNNGIEKAKLTKQISDDKKQLGLSKEQYDADEDSLRDDTNKEHVIDSYDVPSDEISDKEAEKEPIQEDAEDSEDSAKTYLGEINYLNQQINNYNQKLSQL